MAKQVILAVAGSGKTYHLCHSLDKNKKNLILAYTHRNVNNIKKELISAFGVIPELTTVLTFDSFVYRYLICPYEPTILRYFKQENKEINGVTLKNPPPKTIKMNGKNIPNKNYKPKEQLEHYIYKSQYYCSTFSEILLTVNKGTKIIERISNNLNNFFDAVLIDEFQDFREFDYELIIKITKKLNNVLLVGDYYQHSVSAINNSGKPFIRGRGKTKETINYNEYIELLKTEKFDVDITSLVNSRRCPKAVCNMVKDKLHINIEAENGHSGNIYLVNKNIDEIITNDKIIKLTYNDANKYMFNALNWSYSKGDTLDGVCVILTKDFEDILDDNFRLDKISPQTINKLYVALTRTKGDLYLIKNSDFISIKDKYIKS